jgi:hypothetical protein
MTNNVKNYNDLMLLDILLSDNNLSKKAQLGLLSGMSGNIVDTVKSYVGNHINENNKTASVINLLAPAAISAILQSFGFGGLISKLLGLAVSVFHIDVYSVLKGIGDKLTPMLSGDQKVSKQQIDEVVSSAVKEHTGEATQQDEDALNKLRQKSASMQIRQVKILKIAMQSYEKSRTMYVYAMGKSSFLKGGVSNMLSALLRLIFTTIISAAGFMVAGDVINSALGKPSGFTQNVAPLQSTQQTSQKRFKVKSSYQDKAFPKYMSFNIPNNEASISNMLVDFAKEIYDGLDQLGLNIRLSPGFQVVKDRIVNYNISNQGDNLVFIPSYLTSKKDIVDFFIDDVAESAPKSPSTTA